MKDSLYQRIVRNDRGQAVLGVVGWEDDGKFGYTVFPCVGTADVPVRAMIYKPIIIRELSSCKDKADIRFHIDTRIKRSAATYIDGLGINIVTWNNTLVGYIGDVRRGPGTFSYTCRVAYDNVPAIFNAESLAIGLYAYDFDMKHKVDLQKKFGILTYNVGKEEPEHEDVEVDYIRR